MTLAQFRKLKIRDFENGAVTDEIEMVIEERDALLAAARGMCTVASSARDWMYESWSVENNRAWEALMAAVDKAEAGL